VPTERLLIFDELGNAKRVKARLTRFLENEPVQESEKSAIRSTLGITSNGGLGDLLAANNLDDVASTSTAQENLKIPSIGSAPNQSPLNLHLGSMAYQDASAPSVGTLHSDGLARMSNTGGDVALWAESTNANVMIVNVIGASPNYIFDVRDDGTSKFRIDGNGNVVIGNIPTSASGLASGTVWSDSGTLKIVS
jgi:hypothetical protein